MLPQPTSSLLATASPLSWWHYLLIGLLSALILGYFFVRLWLSRTKPSGHLDIRTPTTDRLSQQALLNMVDKTTEELDAQQQQIENEPAPADLLNVVPPEETPNPKKEPPHEPPK